MSKSTNYAARIRAHTERLCSLPDRDAMLAFHHFAGALAVMCEPKSYINPGPTRQRLCEAFERAINRRTGT